MNIAGTAVGCSVYQIGDLGFVAEDDPADIIREIGNRFDGGDMLDEDDLPTHFVFSLTDNQAAAKRKLLSFILKHGLGIVVSSGIKTNPHTGSRITVYVWAVNSKALVKWYKKDDQ